MKRKAFTLIELLVVIAIIAILAAILFPVFAQAKAAAKKTADLSNVKQTALGSLMYSGDSDDNFVSNGEGMITSTPGYTPGDWNPLTPFIGQQNFPEGKATNYGAGGNAPLGFMDPLAVQNWGRETQPYIKNMDMMVSPGAQNDTSNDLKPVANNSRAGKTSYVMNGCVSNSSQTAASKPSELIVFQSRATTVREAICSPRRNYFGDGGRHANDADLSWVGFNFNKGGNFGFADGHAKFKMRKQVKWKDLGYWEWVNINGGWVNPDTNPTMRSDPTTGANYWGDWGACDPAQVP